MRVSQPSKREVIFKPECSQDTSVSRYGRYRQGRASVYSAAASPPPPEPHKMESLVLLSNVMFFQVTLTVYLWLGTLSAERAENHRNTRVQSWGRKYCLQTEIEGVCQHLYFDNPQMHKNIFQDVLEDSCWFIFLGYLSDWLVSILSLSILKNVCPEFEISLFWELMKDREKKKRFSGTMLWKELRCPHSKW